MGEKDLKANIDFVNKNKETLLKEYRNKFILIFEEKIIGYELYYPILNPICDIVTGIFWVWYLYFPYIGIMSNFPPKCLSECEIYPQTPAGSCPSNISFPYIMLKKETYEYKCP